MTDKEPLRIKLAKALQDLASSIMGHSSLDFSENITQDPNTYLLMDPSNSFELGIQTLRNDTDDETLKLVGMRVTKGGKQIRILMDGNYANTLGRGLLALEQEHRSTLAQVGEVMMTGGNPSLRDIWSREQRGNLAVAKTGDKVVPIRKDIEVPK